MDVQTLVWANSVLLLIIGGILTILGFFIRGWIAKTEKKLEAKLDKVLCDERHDSSVDNCKQLFKHKHAPVTPEGRGGEVIIP
jgi:hypothetical protein